MVVATANVNTLLDARRVSDCLSLQTIGRVQLLEMSMCSAGIDLVGIQEGRIQHDQQKSGIEYDQYIAGANAAGSYGSQVWVKRNGPFQVSSFIPLGPRLVELVGSLRNIEEVVHVFSGHAPHEIDSQVAKDLFWDCLNGRLIKAKEAGHLVILLIDANARVGPDDGSRVGPYDAETENDNGARFRAALDAGDLMATSSWFDVGYTWRSAYDTTHRIDYICMSRRLHDMTVSCDVGIDVELARTAREDHRCVKAALRLPETSPGAVCKCGKPLLRRSGSRCARCVQRFRRPEQWFNTANMQKPDLAEWFAYEMWSFSPTQPSTIDEHQIELVDFIKKKARHIFGPPAHKPIRAWISERTWKYVKHVGLIRRFMHTARGLTSLSILTCVFMAWGSALRRDFTSGEDVSTVRRPTGWVAKSRCLAAMVTAASYCRLEAMAFHAISVLQRTSHTFILQDRLRHFADAAVQAQKAFLRGDMKGTFAVVKKLSGCRIRPPRCVRLETGEIAADEEQRQQRWQRHFAGVVGGKIIDDQSFLATRPCRPCSKHALDVSPHRVHDTIRRLGRNKGVGKDEIAAELMQCGGFAMAVQMSRIYERVVCDEAWPIAWKGGRVVELFKGKGDALDCNNSRGLLVADHMGKGLASILKCDCDEHYNANIPECQHGAVSGKSTDFAHHFILSCIDLAVAFALCICVLFVDLSKAYDGVVRELLMGIPQNVHHDWESVKSYFASIGIPEDVSKYIFEYLQDHGAVLQQWGVSEKTINLINALHSGAWFQYGECKDYVLTTLGGRQGCKLGGLVFNGVYAIPLRMLEDELKEQGIALRVRRSRDIFSARAGADLTSAQDILDVAFVDDLAVVIFARSPRILMESTQRLVRILVRLCSLFKFVVNWDRGKTEAFMSLRGKHSTAVYSSMRHGDKYGIQFDDLGKFLHVVSKYKHLGSETDIKGSNMPYVKQRCSSAMSAYAPISTRVFGCEELELHLRKSFCSSLVLSRLLFNAHVRVLRPREFIPLNAIYMRVIRRMSGRMRFDAHAGNDLDARLAINAPSLDCIMLQRRLTYAGRLARSSCSALLSILAIRFEECSDIYKSLGASTGEHARKGQLGHALPWARQLQRDMVAMYSYGTSVTGALPDPSSDFSTWWCYMRDYAGEWEKAVSELHFSASVCDKTSSTDSIPSDVLDVHKCPTCTAAFASLRALRSHERTKHKKQTDMRLYADSSATCMCCHTVFSTRLRLIAHLSDARRPSCTEWVAKHGAPLERSVVEGLDAADRDARRVARAAGLTQPRSTKPAVSVTGKQIGRIS